MRNGNVRARWIGVLSVVILTTIYGIRVQGMDAPGAGADGKRADVITIDTLAAFGDLERPPVVFLHDRHTDALAERDKDCRTCHLSEKRFTIIPETLELAIQRVDPLSPRFQRIEDEGRQEVMEIYHDNCIGCHNRMADEGAESGPVTCGGCHQESPEVTLDRTPMGLDQSLHFRHVKAHDKKCEYCHHDYDAVKDRLFYAKGEEGTCRYCHREETEKNRISMRQASHVSCISCHRERQAREMTAGPDRCAGCHDAETLKKIKVVDPVPRIERNQPDATFVSLAESDEAAAAVKARMKAVPFDHKSHETYNDTCRVCHHEAMKPCAGCHTLAAGSSGGGINLEAAMHRREAAQSCVGCHEAKTAEASCAGCHTFMPATRKPGDAFCADCHGSEPPAADAGEDEVKARAAEELSARSAVTATYPDEDIPETVTMKALVDQYEPAKMPHRKIVKTLFAGMEENRLARYFHDTPGTLCQGCHHNTPPDKTPPRCANCHGKAFDARRPEMPGLMAAYHGQCMRCHQRMGIEKPAAVNCTGCHKERAR